jgi:hypothetical protein
MFEREELERERGKDPVGFLLRRIDYSKAPFPIYVDRDAFERVRCTLSWWPNGTRLRREVVPEDPEPVFSRNVYTSAQKVRVVNPVHKALGFEVSERLAFESPGAALEFVETTLRQACGVRPAVLSEGDAMRQINPNWGLSPGGKGE